LGYVLGVDCSLDVRSVWPPSGKTVWDTIVAWLGGKPAFIGRYLGTGGGAATPLSVDEVNFILTQQRVPLLTIFNDSPINGGGAATYQQGVMDAEAAMRQAAAIGQPHSAYIAFDIEAGAAVGVDYIRGLTRTMRAGPYPGSGIVYGLTGPEAALGRALAGSVPDADVARLVLWSAKWLNKGGPVPPDGLSLSAVDGFLRSVGWSPDSPPSFASNTLIWQFAGGAFGGLADEDLMDDRLLKPGTEGSLWLPPEQAPGQAPEQHDVLLALLDDAQRALADAANRLVRLRAALGG
jgi:hypothetical protein